MNDLYIESASDFGREVLQWALDVPAAQRDWKVAGFLDSRKNILDRYECGFSVVGDPYTFDIKETDRFVCAIGNPKEKLKFCNILKSRGAKFINLIHPTAIIGSRSKLGEGCILCPGVIITTDVTIGNYVTLNLHTTIGHNAIIEDGCTLSSHCDVTGWAILKEGVFMGSHASIVPKAVVEKYSVVGAGSVVFKKVEENSTVIGVPAYKI